MASPPLSDGPTAGRRCEARAPRQHATLNVLLKMPGIYDTRGLRADRARNPSGTAAATGDIALPALRRAGLLRLLPRLEVPLQYLLAVPVQHAFRLGDGLVHLLEVLDAERLAADVGMDGDRHDLRALGAFLVQALEAVDALSRPVRGFVVLHDHHRNVVAFHRVRQRDERPVRSRDFSGLVVVDPVADVLDAGCSEVLGRVVGLGEPRPQPPDRPLADELLDRVERVQDHRLLVFFAVDRSLLVAVAHKFPAGVLARLRDARIVNTHARVDRHVRPDFQALVERVKAPEAHAHAVLVPAPVRHVREKRDAGRRGQHLPRHRLRDIPDFEIDDGPDDDALTGGEADVLPVVEPRVSYPVSLDGDFLFFLLFYRFPLGGLLFF